MRYVSIMVASVILASCATEERDAAKMPLTAPRWPRIDGNNNAVSNADIRTVLTLMRSSYRERSRARAIPIYRIHVIDRHTMSVHYWIPGSDTWTYARRVKGRWRIDYADTERVIVTGSYIHAGS